jgi:hypothetical protein
LFVFFLLKERHSHQYRINDFLFVKIHGVVDNWLVSS